MKKAISGLHADSSRGQLADLLEMLPELIVA